MITVPLSWAYGQTYVVTNIDLSETSTGPYSAQRTETASIHETGVFGYYLRASTYFSDITNYQYDAAVPDIPLNCKTNGWTSNGLEAKLSIQVNNGSGTSVTLPLTGARVEHQEFRYPKPSHLRSLDWRIWFYSGATVTGNPPFTYECTFRFYRAWNGVFPDNRSTFRFTVNTAPKGEITLNPLPSTLVCPVNTDCKTQLTVLVSSTPGHISIRFGAHDNVRYILSSGLQSDEYLGTYDTTTPVSNHPIVVSAIVRSTTAGTRIVSVPITAELT